MRVIIPVLLALLCGTESVTAFGSTSVMGSYAGSSRHFLYSGGSVAATPGALLTDKSLAPAVLPASGEPEIDKTTLPGTETIPSTTFKRKSPPRAFFLSLLVPGLGEMYTQSYYQGAAFMAIEATAWTLWGVFQGKGDDWENKYITYRDEHWSFERYNAYRHAVWDQVGVLTNKWDESNPLSRRQADSIAVLVGSHHYDAIGGEPDPSSHDKNEMVGKYLRFSYGWDDIRVSVAGKIDTSQALSSQFIPNPDGGWGLSSEEWRTVLSGALVTPDLDTNFYQYQVLHIGSAVSDYRETYENMRNTSNKHYDRASKMVTVVLLNHVISAIDAARTAKAYNKNHGFVEPPKTRVGMTLMETERDVIPMLTIRRRF
jgi:hypothetical protein